eukprot:TRINITY_DN1123_c0_g1_i3.p1 TRINITY_DN1123_c0_g1~~TRINITY_DN1123_c0_g1_i3.p1  ORF type:complete len:409 (-),score=94.26 TRINITY_DN1123_c0_g1_i3:175-1401(-)
MSLNIIRTALRAQAKATPTQNAFVRLFADVSARHKDADDDMADVATDTIDVHSIQPPSASRMDEGSEMLLIKKLFPDSDNHMKHLYVARPHLTDNPTLRTQYNALFRMYNWMNKVKFSNELFEDMREEGHYPNRLSYKLMILANLKATKHREVMELHHLSRKTLCVCDVITYNAVLTSCTGTGLIRESMEIYKEMKIREVKPNIRTYAILFQSCMNANRPDLALSLNEELSQSGLSHNDYSITPLITCLSSSIQHIDDALKIYRNAPNDGIEVFPATLNSLFAGLARSGRTKELMELKETTSYSLIAYSFFFQALRADQPAKIMNLWKEFMQKASGNMASLYTLRAVTSKALSSLEIKLSYYNIPALVQILEDVSSLFTSPGRVNVADDRVLAEYFSVVAEKGLNVWL